MEYSSLIISLWNNCECMCKYEQIYNLSLFSANCATISLILNIKPSLYSRYPYAKELLNLPTNPNLSLEKTNPFLSGEPLNQEAENVVHLFLQKSFFSQLKNLNNNTPPSPPLPGKIEDLQSPISFKSETEKSGTPRYPSSPYSASYSTREKIRQLRKSFLEADPSASILNKPKVNKYLSKERSGSIESSPSSALPESTDSSEDQSCSCMALSPDLSENNYLTDTVKMEELPKVHHAEIVSVRREDSNSSSESETSSDDDTSINSKNIMVDIKPIPDVSEPDGVSDSASDNITPRLEAPPQKQNIWGPGNRKKSLESGGDAFNESPELADTAPVNHNKIETDLFPNTEFAPMYENRKVRGEIMKDFGEPLLSSSPMLGLDTGDNAGEFYQINPDHRFQDPALSNYQESSQAYALDEDYDYRPKKKGFLSFFKKPGRTKDNGSDDFIHIDPRSETGLRSDSEEEEREYQDLYGDQSPRFHILPPTSRTDDSSPVSIPAVPAQKSLFQPHSSEPVNMNLSQSPQYTQAQHVINLPDCVPNQDDIPPPTNLPVIDLGVSLVFGETDLDAVFKERLERKLDRKLSTSKPTNLDELMDEPLESTRHNESFLSEPDPEPALIPDPEPVSERFYPEHERTQEIDIDAILGLDCTPEETEEEMEKEQNSFYSNSSEIERETRYNTYRNKSVAKAPLTPEPTYTQDYYPSQKIITVNGETTFSASPEFSYMQQFASELNSETIEPLQSSPTVKEYTPYEIKAPEQYISTLPMFNGKPEHDFLPVSLTLSSDFAGVRFCSLNNLSPSTRPTEPDFILIGTLSSGDDRVSINLDWASLEPWDV